MWISATQQMKCQLIFAQNLSVTVKAGNHNTLEHIVVQKNPVNTASASDFTDISVLVVECLPWDWEVGSYQRL